MFTPPPSPQPHRIAKSACTDASTSSSTDCTPSSQETPSKPRSRRRRYIVLLVSAVILGVIAVSAREHTLHAASSYLSIAEPITAHLGIAFAGPSHDLPRKRAGAHRDVLERQQAGSSVSLDANAPVTMTPTPTTDSQSTTAGTAQSATGIDVASTASTSVGAAVYTAPPVVPTPALPVPTPFPAPFDISLSFNITTPSCVAFFNTFVQNVTFRACRPFGLLMSSSQQFQEDQSNLTTLTAVVGGTCNTEMDVDSCDEVMEWHAEQIVMDDNCGPDIDEKEALAVTALEGFRAYRMMRTAGCLINPVTQAYCYTEAVASLLPYDLYFWTTAIGTPLPNATVPTCSTCTESLLATFAQYANDSSLLISGTYPFAAQKARDTCGAGYATNVAVTSDACSVTLDRSRWIGTSAALVMMASALAIFALS